MALQKGSEGFAVTNLQKNLNQIGAAKLVDDGLFGDATSAAVEVFQSVHSLPITGVVDDATQNAITKALVGQIVMPQDGPVPWMAWMKSHIGEVEQSGAKATDFDNEVFSHTSYGRLDGVMAPGCAATACAALEESGFKSPHNAAAESFRNFGVPCDLKPGAIVGFNWEGKKGVHADHVTFCDHIVDDNVVACLGGNQSHQVQVSIFSRQFIDFVRWPSEVAAAEPLPVPEVAVDAAPIKVKKSRV
jgi:hypothetical protein